MSLKLLPKGAKTKKIPHFVFMQQKLFPWVGAVGGGGLSAED